MIKMSGLYSNPSYSKALARFNATRNWSVFKNVHMAVSKHKCPICECALDGTVTRTSNNNSNTTLVATIDHYRPKDLHLYPNLQFDHENYILMCSDCNNAYKGNQFPLHSSTPIRNILATSTRAITNELPLIVNPIFDNIFDLFKIVLKYTTSGKKVLELEAHSTDPYLKEKAEETIRLFSLGNCEDASHSHSSVNVQNCRITLLNHHFTKFHTITSIMKGRQIIDLSEIEQRQVFIEVRNFKLMDYGFYDFIINGNYKNLVS